MPVSQAELQRRIDKAQTALKILRADAPRDEGRHELSAILPDIQKPLDDLRSALQKLQQGVSKLADASIEIDKLHEQLLGVIERLSQPPRLRSPSARTSATTRSAWACQRPPA
jgi:DNA repair ATPase RecN